MKTSRVLRRYLAKSGSRSFPPIKIFPRSRSAIDPDDRPEVLDLMGDRREMVRFAPYTPDCFRTYEESEALYRELLGFREEQTAKPKRGFGRKKRR